jgi:pimeloyl-ACP methyl ester carboxylesterase
VPVRRLLVASIILSCLVLSYLSASLLRPAEAAMSAIPPSRATYKTVTVKGLNIFYREAGPSKAPAILLLHGFPSSSRMFDTLMPLLADRYHLIAPDYPGFGNSEAPPPDQFAYTFDALADIVGAFTEAVHLDRYALYLQNYGGPVGYRVAVAHPERVTALIIQNAIAHEEGLGRLQAVRKGFWADRAANEAKYRAGLASIDVARLRHVSGSPHPERYDPDLWKDEVAFLARAGGGRYPIGSVLRLPQQSRRLPGVAGLAARASPAHFGGLGPLRSGVRRRRSRRPQARRAEGGGASARRRALRAR